MGSYQIFLLNILKYFCSYCFRFPSTPIQHLIMYYIMEILFTGITVKNVKQQNEAAQLLQYEICYNEDHSYASF